MSDEVIKLLLQKMPGNLGIVSLILMVSLVPALVIVVIWAAKTIFNFFRDKDEQRDAGMAQLNTSLNENTLAVVKLTAQMEMLMKRTDEVPEIRKDVDGLGIKVRKLEGILGNK